MARRAVKRKAVKRAVGPTLAQSKTSGVKSRKALTTKIAPLSREAPAESVIHESEVGCESCGRVHGHGHGAGVPCPWHGTCDMPQRIPYFAEWNSCFYFRPYNYSHLARQRDLAVNWWGDARHPYANEMFKINYVGLDEPEELESLEVEIEADADDEMLDEPVAAETFPEVEAVAGALHHSNVKRSK